MFTPGWGRGKGYTPLPKDQIGHFTLNVLHTCVDLSSHWLVACRRPGRSDLTSGGIGQAERNTIWKEPGLQRERKNTSLLSTPLTLDKIALRHRNRGFSSEWVYRGEPLQEKNAGE